MNEDMEMHFNPISEWKRIKRIQEDMFIGLCIAINIVIWGAFVLPLLFK